MYGYHTKHNTKGDGKMAEYESWGWNDFHDPEICEYCDFDDCATCDNGPNNKQRRVIR